MDPGLPSRGRGGLISAAIFFQMYDICAGFQQVTSSWVV